ncbi:MAG: 23S rRNA (uridine(2552)-2'-O)-methyltransferase [Nitrososphaeraceae archaeon]|nr:23S rRNA (uridine(2552)-2'-O)-methyltransferase [Nitrososphaeraceae archaeon]
MRLSEARKDRYRKLAKDKGYRSRAAYKLKQINESYHLFEPKSTVLDIGCAPGGWIQVVQEITNNKCLIIGVDIKNVEPIKDVVIIQGDIESEVTIKKIESIARSKISVILSDMSPNVSGLWEIDHVKQILLTEKALNICNILLRQKGNAVFKVFQGEMLKEIEGKMKQMFEKVYIAKPDASRKESSELYYICLNFRY